MLLNVLQKVVEIEERNIRRRENPKYKKQFRNFWQKYLIKVMLMSCQ